MNDGDVALYTEFTSLKSKGIKPWIAIGGFDFSDKGATHTAWSNMASTSESRAVFIASLKQFIAQYGFAGVDLGKKCLVTLFLSDTPVL